jgi:hypothetical protein
MCPTTTPTDRPSSGQSEAHSRSSMPTTSAISASFSALNAEASVSARLLASRTCELYGAAHAWNVRANQGAHLGTAS